MCSVNLITMNRVSRSIILFFLLLIVSGLTAQVDVIKAGDLESLSGKKGVFYVLPRTLVKIDLLVEKTEYYKGPFADYAGKYLGLENVISSDKNEYSISEIKIGTVPEPDPEQVYFVQFMGKALEKDEAIILSLTEAGYIENYNGLGKSISTSETSSKKIKGNEIYSEVFKYFAEMSLEEKKDTIVKKVLVDTIFIEKKYFSNKWQQKNTEQKAAESAAFITKIRDNRFNLVSGFQEVAYESGTIEYMDTKLKELEDEYMSLFTGVSIKKTLRYSFTILPTKEEAESLIPALTFSPRYGIKDRNSTVGDKIYLRIERNSQLTGLGDKTQTMQTDAKEEKGLCYRIPEQVMATIIYNDEMQARASIQVSHFGTLSRLPANVKAASFYPETGALKTALYK